MNAQPDKGKEKEQEPPRWRAERPYLFAYDVADPGRLRRVHACLQRWRVDGQYSVHETWLRPAAMQQLAVELVDLVDRKADRLLVTRLQLQGGHPVRQLAGRRFTAVHGLPPRRSAAGAGKGRDLLHLLAYDIREPLRLRRVHRASQRGAIALQKSVFLHRGSRTDLDGLLERVLEEVHRTEDDVRLYAFSRLGDLWFLSGEKPPLAEWTEPPRVDGWSWLKQLFLGPPGGA